MRSFLKYTLATIVGIFIMSILSIFLFIGIISTIVATSKKEVAVQSNSMLMLKLNEEIVDRDPNDPFQDLNIPGFSGMNKVGLDAILSSIEKAKHEEKIKGIFLRLDNVNAGYSACEEIRNALIEFKESGKFIYAYSEGYSQKAYYLATAADKIFINPEGMLLFSGISSQSLFFKKALEKLGIEMQVIRHGKFKAAVEPFILDKMSDENKEQVKVYVGSIWNSVLEKIAASRNLSVARLNQIADENMMMQKSDLLLQYGLVDSILYEDQLLDFLRTKTDTKPNEGIPTLSVSKMKNLPSAKKGKGFTKNKLAIIYAEGEIVVDGAESMGGEGISGRDLAKEIRIARTDSSIKAIVLRVNSPGGSSLGSELIWREVKLAAEQKTMVVSMGNLAASGGYYISCAADTIVANPTTITGSIGVFGLVPNIQKLMENKLGITSDVVKTNTLADMPSINRPLTPTEQALFQNMVENVYTTFVNHVAEGRSMSYEQVDAIGQGRVWTGANAKELGLIDVLGDLGEAVRIAKEMAGLEECRIVKLPEQKDPIQEMLKSLSGDVKVRLMQTQLGEYSQHYQLLQTVSQSKGIMTRMPYNLVIE